MIKPFDPTALLTSRTRAADEGAIIRMAQKSRDLRSLGHVVDMDFPNAFTSDRKNFLDPFHIANSAVIREALWGDHPNLAIQR